ncbi:hypothetical protein GTU73_01035 [Rathayibacter sp. VKM Ac-2804]|uniref:hypothetical protein n=1 Tax=Rathayibacter sp. VKM Ac-2804 TaxID=2609257 RepID=UPI00132EEB23|nr:hypothetical protein [Rathayibacter sp. VKM Ac-2804]QHF22729.1 hypothetical protein GTU73_01035 [Rathayibacter sp. VKM Ac-2804]
MTHDDEHPTTSDGHGAVERRTLVAGAVWTLPVVALATAAPAAAASPAACPVLTDPSQWRRYSSGYGDHGASTIREEGGRYLYYQEEDDSRSFEGLNLDVWWVAQLPVVAGTTYTFLYRAGGRYADSLTPATRGPQYARLEIDGAAVSPDYSTDTSQYGKVQLTTDFSLVDYSSLWVAKTTGTVQLIWHFVVPGRKGVTTDANDDIRITLPIITCSP